MVINFLSTADDLGKEGDVLTYMPIISKVIHAEQFAYSMW